MSSYGKKLDALLWNETSWVNHFINKINLLTIKACSQLLKNVEFVETNQMKLRKRGREKELITHIWGVFVLATLFCILNLC